MSIMFKKFMLGFSIILIALIIGLIVVFIPILFGGLLNIIFSSCDGYLLTGVCFYIFLCLLFFIIPFFIFLSVFKKNDRINGIKRHKGFFTIIFFIILLFEFIIGFRGYVYFMDIKEGFKEAIMIDAVVEKHYSYKSSSLYITGYIDNKKVSLKITGDARLKVKKNKKYEKLGVKYYKNLGEVYDVSLYLK